MKEIIKTILHEWQETNLPETIKRENNLSDYLDLKVKKIVAITGFRRVGKTYLVFELIKRLLKNRNKNKVLYINFEDERIPLKIEFLTELLPVIKETFKELPEFIFLDEIQNIPGWSKWLRRVYDRERINFFITGSSSKMSSKEIPSELRGRSLEVEIFSLSFKEFLSFKKIEVDFEKLPYLENERIKILSALEEYLFWGGMPEIVLSSENKKKEILHQYYSTVVRKDITERFRIRNEEILKNILQLLLNSTSFSLNRLYNNLKSLGVKAGKTTLGRYVSYIANSYFINFLPIFSYKIKDQMRYQKKIYFVDNGFLNNLSLRFSKNLGRLYENSVFLELRRRGTEGVFYWQNRQQREVDFVIHNLKPEALIQVCYSLDHFETKEREIKNLLQASKELKVDNLLVINKEKEGEEKFQNKIIKYIPLWKWLLEI